MAKKQRKAVLSFQLAMVDYLIWIPSDFPRNTFMKKLAAIISSVFLALISVSAADIPRVGLISLDDNARNVSDLTLGLFSKNLEITFVERNRFQSIAEEIKLNNSKFAARSWTLDSKAMENADIFVILRNTLPASPDENLEVVIFDAVTGIRLIDCVLPGQTEFNQAEAVSTLIRSAVSKREKFHANGLLKLAFMPLVPVNLSAEQFAVAKQVESLIVRSIASRPDVIVLERRYLRYLLDEPNAKVNCLTKKLLTGSLLVRLTASPKNERIALLLTFSAPGKDPSKFEIKMELDPSKPIEPQLKQALFSIPKTTPRNEEDRKSEAGELYRQAYFAISHSLDADALTLSASGAALNTAQELSLADICIRISARTGWGCNNEKMDIVIRNLKTAVRLLDKHDRFGFTAMIFCGEWGGVLPQSFASFTPEQQRDMREIMEKFFELQYREFEKGSVIKMIKSEGKTINEKFIVIQFMTKYLDQMDYVVKQQWDLSYYARYIIPVLKKFITETNELIPEMEKFYLLSEPERQKKYGRTKLEFLQNSHFAKFYNGDLAEQTEANKIVFREVFTLMTQSKLLGLAWRGHLGLLRLDVKKYQNDGVKMFPEAVAKYNDALIRCFENCSLPEGGAARLELDGPVTQETRFRIQELSMERFAFYNPMNGRFLNYDWRETIPAAEAPAYQKRLFGYITKFKSDPRVKLSPDDYVYTLDHLEGALRMFEEHFQLPSLLGERQIPDTPYSRLVEPLAMLKLPDGARPTEPCFDGSYIIFAVLENDKTQLIKLDTEHDFAPTYGMMLEQVSGWGGTDMTGCLSGGYYISWNYKYVYLYPLDGGEVQKLDFEQFYEGAHLCMTGIGDRLFLSYGQFAGHRRPGTVIEYNIKDKTTKIIISTLDKSIDWPLKNQNWPYHIHQLVPDAKNHRILMLIHSGFFAYGFAAPPMKLYAYDYENCKWETLSGGLPIYEGYTGGTIFCDGDDIFVMARNYGFGLVRKDKVWQPILMKNCSDGRLTKHLPKMPENSKLELDYSHPAEIPGIRWGVDKMDFINYSDGVIYDDNALIDLKGKFFYPFRQKFRPSKVIGRKYVIQWNSYNNSNSFVIGILKDTDQLKREAVK